MLGWHVCRTKLARKIFLRHEFSHEKCSEMFPEIFEPLFCGSGKIPQTSHQMSLPKNKKKFTDELLQGRRENKSTLVPVFVPGEHANIPSFRFSVRGNMRTYPRSGFRSGGTSAKTTLLETTLLGSSETL